MNELLEFATRLIELEGGAVAPSADGVEALLPSTLVEAWRVSEQLELAESERAGAERLAYGTELLERMIETVTHALPIACARLELAPLRLGQVRAAAEHFRLRNGVVDPGEVRLGRQTRVWADALATLHGDEKRELLTTAVVSARTGTLVEGFEHAAVGLSPAPRPHAVHAPEPALAAVLAACTRRAEVEAESFRGAMTRRFERDRRRIDGYFDDLLMELGKRAGKGRLDPGAMEDKRRAFSAERAAKLDALSARFVLRIEVLPVALRLIEVDGAFITMILRRRKASRTLELEYDAATRRLVPISCDGCGAAALRPAACDDAVHLLCETCAPRAEGRFACPACKPLARAQARALAADA